MTVSSRSGIINTHLQILVKKKVPAIVALFFLLLISHLWAENWKEYIYLEGKVVAVESYNTPAPCTYDISPTSASPAAGGGSGGVSVTSSAGSCTWTTTNNASSWVTITGGNSGTGGGTVSYTVSANNTGSARSGTITIAGNTFTINQPAPPPCTYNISPASASLAAGGGSGSVSVTSSAGSCTWATTNNASSWVTITGGSSGTGNGTVSYTVSANNSLLARSGTLTIAGKMFTINQPGVVCTYGISPTSANPAVASGGGSGSVNVTSSNGICTWTTTNNASSWITITGGGSGTGNGTVSYTVSANTAPSRSGTLTIAGNTFTINQADGCTYIIFPPSMSFTAAGGNSVTNVSVSDGSCTWTATNNAFSWITITGSSSGTGGGAVSYSVGKNSGNQRSGTMTVAGKTLTISQQSGMTCQQTCGFHREFCESDMPDCEGSCTEAALAYCGPYNFLCAASYLDACIPICESQHMFQCAAEYDYCVSFCN